ncbi:MAG: hypothetical protein KDD64_03555 [Bdellovibrionales bacterium]|nr:hypothetical protein [Bdellovibrionales bacterium]
MFLHKLRLVPTFLLFVFFLPSAYALNVAVIKEGNAAGATPKIEQSTQNIISLLSSAGVSVSEHTARPLDLSGFDILIDVRVFAFGTDSGMFTPYAAFLANGGRILVITDAFPDIPNQVGADYTNQQITIFLGFLGSGSFSTTTPAPSQHIGAPFTGPNAIFGNSINLNVGVGFQGGAGQLFLTDQPGGNTGVGITAGSLMVVGDSNIFDCENANRDALARNILTNLTGISSFPFLCPSPGGDDSGCTEAEIAANESTLQKTVKKFLKIARMLVETQSSPYGRFARSAVKILKGIQSTPSDLTELVLSCVGDVLCSEEELSGPSQDFLKSLKKAKRKALRAGGPKALLNKKFSKAQAIVNGIPGCS